MPETASVLLSKIFHADFLELPAAEKKLVFFDSHFFGQSRRYLVAPLGRSGVDHGEQVVVPALRPGALVTMADLTGCGQNAAHLLGPFFGNIPGGHGVGLVSKALVANHGPETPDGAIGEPLPD